MQNYLVCITYCLSQYDIIYLIVKYKIQLIEQIEAAEKKEKQRLETLRAKEEKIRKELEEKMRQEKEEKMEYWVIRIVLNIKYSFKYRYLIFTYILYF